MRVVVPFDIQRFFKQTRITVALLAILASRPILAQDGLPSTTSSAGQTWELHLQSTLIGQGVLPFPAEYSGANSLDSHGQVKDTLSFDITGDVRPWQGGEFYVDGLLWQGYGLSDTTGLAAFPNGEAYRAGRTYPDAVIAEAYFRQALNLGTGGKPGWGQPDGGRERRLLLTVGRFAATDIFDRNAYANDPRTQFMNWAFVNNLSWDYPADTLGFTNGVTAELDWGSWAARGGVFEVSRKQNGMKLDWNVTQDWSLAEEIERRYSIGGRHGAIRLLGWKERAHLGNYQESLSDPQDIAHNGQIGYRSKYGFGINMEQAITNALGTFMRLGWNDGTNETWEFTDVDRTASLGITLKGDAWRRPADTVGLAAVVDGISSVHQQFLAHGGLGITVGDGALDYRSERVGEVYYSWKVAKHLWFTLDYQLGVNPAYNHSRGPANIFSTRLHWEF